MTHPTRRPGIVAGSAYSRPESAIIHGRARTVIVYVVVGLVLFMQGLETGLFPIGEAMADAFARKGNAGALLAFAFCLVFGTTVAEPALIAVGAKAADIAVGAGAISTRRAGRPSVHSHAARLASQGRSATTSISSSKVPRHSSVSHRKTAKLDGWAGMPRKWVEP